MFQSDARQEISTLLSVQPAVESESHSRDQPKSPHKLTRYFHDSKGPLFFNCQQWGRIANTCPNPKVPKPVRQILRVHDFSGNDGEQTLSTLYAMGEVNNHPVQFFLDSGAEISVINAALLHQLEEFGMDKATLLKDRPIADVHGHTVSMPIVSILFPPRYRCRSTNGHFQHSATGHLARQKLPLIILVDPSSYRGVSRLSRTDSETCSSLDD